MRVVASPSCARLAAGLNVLVSFVLDAFIGEMEAADGAAADKPHGADAVPPPAPGPSTGLPDDEAPAPRDARSSRGMHHVSSSHRMSFAITDGAGMAGVDSTAAISGVPSWSGRHRHCRGPLSCSWAVLVKTVQ